MAVDQPILQLLAVANAAQGRDGVPVRLRSCPGASNGAPAGGQAIGAPWGQPLQPARGGPPRPVRQRQRPRPVALGRPRPVHRRSGGGARHPRKDPRSSGPENGTTVTAVTGSTRTPEETAELCARILEEIERVVVGRRRTLELVLIGILAAGHILLEDVPGLGKTLIARSFAKVLGLNFARIQLTPDLLPSDVVGAPLYDQRNGEMVFRPGPVFTQLLLADEINRTPPKTQAALLEAMGEGQVSVDGQTRRLPEPFIVLATDNPIEY